MHLGLFLLLLPTLILASVPPHFARDPSALIGRQTATCASSCSSASDLAAENAIGACAATDETCVCTNAALLSSGCLTCILTAEGLTVTELEQACAGGGGSATVPASVTATGTTTAPSSSPTAYCTTECTSASDQAGVTRMEQCANSDLTCLCTTVSTLSTACRNCWLGLVGLTQAQYTADCAGGGSMSGGSGSSMGMGMSVGNGGSSATSTSSSSASSPTSPPKSDGRRAGVGGALGVVLAAMVVLA